MTDKADAKKDAERKWQNECKRIDRRNAEAQRRIDDHEELKRTSRAYQRGGAWHSHTSL